MPCRWCDSTGGECGCGLGYCDHCGGTGHVTPPPFGDGMSCDPIDDSIFANIAKCAKDLGLTGELASIRATAYLASGQMLPPEDEQKFLDYWNDPYRDVTIGEYYRQITERAIALKK